MSTANFLYYSPNWTRGGRVRGLDDLNSLVPKDPAQNVAYRRWLLNECAVNDDFAAEVRVACKRDILFWINSFAFIKEPRKHRATDSRVFNWVLWPVQEWWLTEAEESFGVENVITPKTRETGVSWKMTALFLHRCLFYDEMDLALASRTKEKVDNPFDPSSLFGKLDILMKYMPNFLIDKSQCTRGQYRFHCGETNSSIIGYASTGDLNLGGRNTALGNDEFGAYPAGEDEEVLESVKHVTDSQFFVSTYSKRANSTFNRIALDPTFPGKRLFVRWKDVLPFYAGAYTTAEDGSLKILDELYWAIRDQAAYPFKLEPTKPGKERSPWYDKAVSGMKPEAIARQVDVDLEGSTKGGLDREEIQSLRVKHVKGPVCRGKIGYNNEDFKPRWIEDPNGSWLLWFRPVAGRPPEDDCFAIGADISTGNGASDSVLEVFSRTTGKQMAEYSCSTESPKRFARHSIAAALWFAGSEKSAYLMPESNGGMAGVPFIREVCRNGYRWMLHRRTKRDEIGGGVTKMLGYHTPSEGPGDELMELVRAIWAGECEVYSDRVYEQLKQYILKNGKLIHHSEARDKDDETDKTHGDCAVAAALGWFGVTQRRATVDKPKEPEAPPNSLAWYRANGYFKTHTDDYQYADEAGV